MPSDGCEHIGLTQLFDLARTLKKIKQLRRQRGPSAAAIEALEKRIFRQVLEHEFARQTVSQSRCQTGLANADGSLDDDKSWRAATHLKFLNCHNTIFSLFQFLDPRIVIRHGRHE